MFYTYNVFIYLFSCFVINVCVLIFNLIYDGGKIIFDFSAFPSLFANLLSYRHWWYIIILEMCHTLTSSILVGN